MKRKKKKRKQTQESDDEDDVENKEENMGKESELEEALRLWFLIHFGAEARPRLDPMTRSSKFKEGLCLTNPI